MFVQEPSVEDDGAIAEAIAPQLAIIERCIEAGRFKRADPWLGSTFLAATHGLMAWIPARIIKPDRADEHLDRRGVSLFVGFGDSAVAARHSILRARQRTAEEAGRA